MRSSFFLRLVPLTLLALSLVSLAACNDAAPARSAAEQAQIDRAGIEQRLRGNWQLVDYRPEVPLDGMTQQLLMQQLQTMIVRVENGRLLADSPTIHVNRALQISEVAGNLFKANAIDENGVGLLSSCELSDDGSKLFFRGETEPWRGTGTLARRP